MIKNLSEVKTVLQKIVDIEDMLEEYEEPQLISVYKNLTLFFVNLDKKINCLHQAPAIIDITKFNKKQKLQAIKPWIQLTKSMQTNIGYIQKRRLKNKLK